MRVTDLHLAPPEWARLWDEINAVQPRGGWWSWSWREWSLLESWLIRASIACRHHKIGFREVHARVTALGSAYRDSKGGKATTVVLSDCVLSARRTYTTDDESYCFIGVPAARVPALVAQGVITKDDPYIHLEYPDHWTR